MKLMSVRIVVLAALVFIVAPSVFAGDLEKFTDDELKSFLSDKSYPIGGDSLGSSKGAFYFHSDGALEAIWKGKKETSSWKVEGDSKFCYTLQMFGPRECLQLLKDVKTGGFVQVYGSKKRKLAREAIASGKQF